MSEPQDKGAKVLAWWRTNLAARTQIQPDKETEEGRREAHAAQKQAQTAARALSAKLRRGTYPAILFEPQVQNLLHQIQPKGDALKRFCQLLNVLGEVREYDHASLAKRLKGGDKEPLLSHLRFKQLMTAEDDELATLLRRAVAVAGNRCNVAMLARDMLAWNDRTRARWCLEYFGVGEPRIKAE